MRKGWKRVHRLVVLPDFQGIGIGTKFITEVAKEYIENDWNVSLITTTPALVHSLKLHKNWPLVRYGRVTTDMNKMKDYIDAMGGSKDPEKNKEWFKNSSSRGRITYSFEYSKKD